eukprot:scaffold33529_cov116-Skeletonema_dohrnii-CCMP3373.AAC.5
MQWQSLIAGAAVVIVEGGMLASWLVVNVVLHHAEFGICCDVRHKTTEEVMPRKNVKKARTIGCLSEICEGSGTR